MLFEMLLFQFDITEMRQANTYLGPMCFALFMFFVAFIGMTMFISIIIDNFRMVRKQNKIIYSQDYDMLIFIWNKFKRWIG
jgi:hypothetical protein